MLDYSQPDFYRFNDDSTFLVYEVAKRVGDIEGLSVLDLFCGCGIIGLELSQKIKIDHLNLVDIQLDYEVHLSRNIEHFSKAKETSFFISSYEEFLADNQKFDLILANPPYFNASSSRPSVDERRNIARRFVHGSMEHFIELAKKSLTKTGKLYFLFPLESKDKIKGELIAQKGSVGLFYFCD